MKHESYSIVFITGKYVSHILTKHLSSDLLFHNLHHTINVVRGVRDISRNVKLTEDEKEILLLAAWFHDTGHIKTYEGHELESQKIAQQFLENENYPSKKITKILKCIAATKMPQAPQDILEQVICDADLYHLSLPEYPHIQHLLREEWNRVLNKKYTDEEWKKVNFEFLNSHQYFTSYGKNALQKYKSINVGNWEKLMEEI